MRRPHAAGRALEALTPLIEKLSALEATALDGRALSVVTLATELAATCAAVARDAMALILEQAARTQPACAPCPCGGEASSTGFEGTSFVGRFGRVSVCRRRMACARCDTSGFPFDQVWGLPTGEYADDVREATNRLSCRLGSFEEAVAELQYLWGVAPDASTAQRWVAQDGARADAVVQLDADARWTAYGEPTVADARGDQRGPTRTAGFGVVEVDGVHALTWKPGHEPRRKTEPAAAATTASAAPAATSETGERATRHQAPSALSDVTGSPMGPQGRSCRVRGREICMGLTYLGEDAGEESPGRGVLLHRRYCATLNDRDGFWRKLHAAATVQGVLQREKLVRVSDAGTYFVDQTTELFCDQPLIGILDLQHGRQHVWEAGHKVVSDPKKTEAWVTPRTQAIWDGRVDDVIVDLAAERKRRRGSAQRDAIDGLHGYLERHKHMMDYPRYREAGYPIASAAIESANKRLVGRRCKQGGMIWSEPGLEAIVALRVAFYNRDTWRRLWPHAALPAVA
jgi:hypothetical protein